MQDTLTCIACEMMLKKKFAKKKKKSEKNKKKIKNWAKKIFG